MTDCLFLKRFDTNYELFVDLVKKNVEDCSKKLYDNPPINADDPHAIRYK